MKRVIFVLLMLLMVGCNSGCKSTLTPLGWGYFSVSRVSKARDAISKALRTACGKKKYTSCIKAHPGDKAAQKKCLGKCPEAVNAWHKKAYPSIQATINLTLGGLDAAKAKGEKDWNWFKVLLPAVCGAAKAANDLKPVIGNEKADKAIGYIDLGRKWVCP